MDINFQEEEICLEIMVLQESLNTTITTLKKYVNDIARILQELAKGNLAVTSQVEYQGDFIKLSDSIHDITGNLSTLVKEIDNSAKQFKSISVEVSETSGQVAKGAVTQEENINRLAGKGFAVVAEEIRGLSEDTSKASESINEMIQKNNQAVEQGLGIMVKTVEVLEKNFQGFVSAKEGIEQMADVLQQQREYITKISNSVSEIEQIVQDNTEISKGNSSMAEEMTKQAEQLNGQLDKFTLKE